MKHEFFLFQFYHAEDLKWVINGGPWSFDGAMLALAVIPQGEEPWRVPLVHINMWIQIHDLPTGFMSEGVGKQLGDFFGEFLEYDHKNNSSIWREFMRIRVENDVRKPLKRRKKLIRKNGSEVIVTCKYERLGEFCFTCGLVSHTELYCIKFLEKGSEEVSKDRGGWLRAAPRRTAGPVNSKWLREDGDPNWDERLGRVNPGAKTGESNYSQDGNQMFQMSNFRKQLQLAGGGSHPVNSGVIFTSGLGVEGNSILQYGPSDEELDGIHVTERNRMRGGPGTYDIMDTEGGLKVSTENINPKQTMEVALSDTDYVTSSYTVLATLALQASHEP